MKYETTDLSRPQGIEEKLYTRASDFFSKNPAIDPADFNDLYDPAVIKEDLKYAAKREKEISAEAGDPESAQRRQFALAFEAMVLDQMERSDWLGETAMTIRASRYDDIANSVDMIVEFTGESSPYLAFAVDITTGRDLNKKFLLIENEIQQDVLATVKYYNSENFRGELKNIPRVVIGADKKTITDFGALWLDNDNAALARHPIQKIILGEIAAQARSFSVYAEKAGKVNAAAAYRRVLKIIEKIMEDKKTIPVIYRDKVCAAILAQCQNFSSGTI